MSYNGLPEAVRKAVNERDGGRCRWCGATNRGVDHHHVRYRKGVADDVLENLVSLCRGCHSFVHGTPRANGIRITKGIAQDVLYWVISQSGRVGTSRWRSLKREFVLAGLCEHGERAAECSFCQPSGRLFRP